MLLEDFGITFVLLAQKLFQCKIELIYYFDYNDIQKERIPFAFGQEGQVPCSFAELFKKEKKSIYCHVLTQSQ